MMMTRARACTPRATDSGGGSNTQCARARTAVAAATHSARVHAHTRARTHARTGLRDGLPHRERRVHPDALEVQRRRERCRVHVLVQRVPLPAASDAASHPPIVAAAADTALHEHRHSRRRDLPQHHAVAAVERGGAWPRARRQRAPHGEAALGVVPDAPEARREQHAHARGERRARRRRRRGRPRRVRPRQLRGELLTSAAAARAPAPRRWRQRARAGRRPQRRGRVPRRAQVREQRPETRRRRPAPRVRCGQQLHGALPKVRDLRWERARERSRHASHGEGGGGRAPACMIVARRSSGSSIASASTAPE